MHLNLEPLNIRIRRLAADRARTVLVILGVIWGTLSLTVVLAFGEALYLALHQAMRGSGKDFILLWSGSTTRPHEGLPAGRRIELLPEDAERLARNVPGIRAASAEFIAGGETLRYEGQRLTCGVHGVHACYAGLRSIIPQAGGRFFNERDDQARRRVIFLGNSVKERLFGPDPAVGRTVLLWGTPFTVVGVLRPKVAMSNYEWRDRDKVFVPAETMRQTLGLRHVAYLVVGLSHPSQDEAVLKGMRQLLGAARGFDPQDEGALGVHNQVTFDRITAGIILGTRILMGIVGLLGLLVALVGVANVLYVMVSENRREISLLMALGSRPRWVLADLLADGVLLTLMGACIGIPLAAAVLGAFNRLPLGEEPRAYLGTPELSLALALMLSLLLGLAGAIAAYIPARQAALADPAEILREE